IVDSRDALTTEIGTVYGPPPTRNAVPGGDRITCADPTPWVAVTVPGVPGGVVAVGGVCAVGAGAAGGGATAAACGVCGAGVGAGSGGGAGAGVGVGTKMV